MLDFIYYPVSAILWFWHKAFGSILGPDNGFAWALSVVFLVFTLRALLFQPAIKPDPHDPPDAGTATADQGPAEEVRRRPAAPGRRDAELQKEHGFNPLMGCLPVLVQAPVFLGLYHVLRSFNRTGTGLGQLGMIAEDNANTPNYIFSATDVQSFLSARLFGAPISAAIASPQSALASFGSVRRTSPTVATIAAVAVPLMVHRRPCHPLQRPGIGAEAASGHGGQPAVGNHEQADAVGFPARRSGRRTVPADRDPAVLGEQQRLDLRSAAPRLRPYRPGGIGETVGDCRTTAGRRAPTRRPTESCPAEAGSAKVTAEAPGSPPDQGPDQAHPLAERHLGQVGAAYRDADARQRGRVRVAHVHRVVPRLELRLERQQRPEPVDRLEGLAQTSSTEPGFGRPGRTSSPRRGVGLLGQRRPGQADELGALLLQVERGRAR